jgi:hypothetical protein
VRVRPATSFEVDRASYAVNRILTGLVAGEDAAMMAALVLGPEFQAPDFTKEEWRQAAAQRFALLDLAVECIEGWEGIVGDDEQPLSPSREAVALLLRDAEISARIRMVINSSVHAELEEKNALAASPNGGAATDENTARLVVSPATAAPSADSQRAASDAPSTSSHQ